MSEQKRMKMRFDPHPKITHKDLIDILKQKWATVDISVTAWENMAPDIKKHFKAIQ